MPGRLPLKTERRRPLLTTLALALLVTLAVTATAVAASNSIHVSATKKKITVTGTAATANDSVQVNFDPHKCAASYATEIKRGKVAFTDFAHQKSGHFKVTVNLPIHEPSGDKPGHYACTYLLEIVDNGTNIKSVASASGKY
jgi:hypothetical protein